MLQIREEVSFTKDRIIVRGKLVSRGKASGLKNLTTEYLKRLTVPLYPIAVQRRIVAKVDELMTFCDQLETSLTDTTATRRLLDEALEPAEKLAA